MAAGESMSSLLQKESVEGSSVDEMMNSMMLEEQFIAVFGSEQIVFSAMQDCRKICPNTGHMGCPAPSTVPGPGDGCSHFVYKVGHQDETWEQGRDTIADCSSHANKPKMKRDFCSQAKGSLGAVEHGRGYLALPGLPSRQR